MAVAVPRSTAPRMVLRRVCALARSPVIPAMASSRCVRRWIEEAESVTVHGSPDGRATGHDTLRGELRARGYEVRTADGYDAALRLARADSPEYAVVDLRMPGRSGLEVVRDLAALDAGTRIVILTGYVGIGAAGIALALTLAPESAGRVGCPPGRRAPSGWRGRCTSRRGRRST